MKTLKMALLTIAVSAGFASNASAQVTATSNTDGSILVVGTNGDDNITVEEINDILFVYDDGILVDTFPSPELFTTAVTIQGLDGDDRLETKTSLITVLEGGEGNDDLFGGDSADTLRGGPGDDKLYGLLGFDELIGNEGDDFLQAGPFTGDDNNGNRLDGGPGLDTLIGSDSQSDVFIANDGELDQIEGHCGDEASLFIDEGLDNLRDDCGSDDDGDDDSDDDSDDDDSDDDSDDDDSDDGDADNSDDDNKPRKRFRRFLRRVWNWFRPWGFKKSRSWGKRSWRRCR